ncbi:MAG TPA: hypothetical protein VEU33_07010 [Archangium sp.]|nr:hypothetical protein [Archangium sp.]
MLFHPVTPEAPAKVLPPLTSLRDQMREAAAKAAADYERPRWKKALDLLGTVLKFVAGLVLAIALVVVAVILVILLAKVLLAGLVALGISAVVAKWIVIGVMVVTAVVLLVREFSARRKALAEEGRTESQGLTVLKSLGSIVGITQIVEGVTQEGLSPFERGFRIGTGVGTLLTFFLGNCFGRYVDTLFPRFIPRFTPRVGPGTGGGAAPPPPGGAKVIPMKPRVQAPATGGGAPSARLGRPQGTGTHGPAPELAPMPKVVPEPLPVPQRPPAPVKPLPGIVEVPPLSPLVPPLAGGIVGSATGPSGAGMAPAPSPGPSPHPRPPVTLRLPPQKGVYLSLYRSYLGILEHRIGRDRSTRQRAKWEAEMHPLRGGEMTLETWCWGLALELSSRDILRPRWSRERMWPDMEVDHKLEMQVSPIGREAMFDEPWNYELLDDASNSDSGNELKNNIIAERRSLAAATGDSSWLTRDLLFEAVIVQGTAGPAGRWSFEEVRDGEHKAYEELEGVEPDEDIRARCVLRPRE